MISRNQFLKLNLLSAGFLLNNHLFKKGFAAKHEIEILHANPLNLDKSKLSFLEGPAKGLGNELLFTHRNRETGWNGIHCVNIKDKSPDLKIAYEGNSFGALFLRNEKYFFTGKTPNGGHEAVGCFHSYKNGRLGDLEIKVDSRIGQHALLNTNDLVVTKDESIYFTDKKGKAVGYISPNNKAKILYKSKDSGALDNLDNPNGIILSPDEKRLFITDNSNFLYGDLEKPGSIKQELSHLLPGTGITEMLYHNTLDLTSKTITKKKVEQNIVIGKYSANLRIDGMTVDHEGTIYGAALGSGCIVGFDGNSGKLKRVIKCQHGAINCTIAGENNDTMCIVGGGAISIAKLPVKVGL